MSRIKTESTDDGAIIVEYMCDRCMNNTIRDPSLVIRPIRPIPETGPILHTCEKCE